MTSSTQSLFKSKNGLRPCLFNLFVYVEEKEHLPEVCSFLEKNLEIFPCRIFLVSLKKEGPVDISFHTSSKENSSSDRIKIESTLKDLHEVPFLIYPLLVTDLPLYLFLAQDLSCPFTLLPEENPFLKPFLKSFERILIDSREVTHLQKFYERLEHIRNKFDVPIVDLLSIEAKDWQNALKKSLQDKDSLLQNLLHIHFSFQKETPLPFYLLAFLGGALNFQFEKGFQSKETGDILYEFQGRTCAVSLNFKGESDFLILESKQEILTFTFDSVSLFLEEHFSHENACEIPKIHHCTTLKKKGGWMRELFYEPIDPFTLLAFHFFATTPFSSRPRLNSCEAIYRDTKRMVAIFPNEEEVAKEASLYFIRQAKRSIAQKGFFTVAFSGGKTPKKLFEFLASSKESVDWSKIYVFFSDERAVPPTDEASNYKLCFDTLLSQVPIAHEHIFRMHGEEATEKQASLYEMLIKEKVPSASFDLIFLGLGEDGHTASLFPNEPYLEEAKKKALVLSPFVASKNTHRMTFTFTLLSLAKEVLFLACGENKREALKGILEDNQKFPASLVGSFSHPALFFVDKASYHL